MVDPVEAKVPRIFLAYSPEDKNWVDIFTHNDLFGLQLGNVVVEDPQRLGVGFGSLSSFIANRIHRASCVVAFVSEYFTSSNESLWAKFSWQESIEAHYLRKLLFVPVMLDADSKVWWDEQRKGGSLQHLSSDYQASDFTANGTRIYFDLTMGPVTQRVVELARAIKKGLTISDTQQREIDTIAQSYSNRGLVQPTRPIGSCVQVTLLAHPTNEFPEDLAQDARRLDEALRARGLATENWGNGWADDAMARGAPAAEHADPHMFVQPLMAQEAGHHASNSHETGSLITAVGVPAPRVTLWLPPPRQDKRFREAEDRALANAFPVLRHDSAAELAEWLNHLLLPRTLAEDEMVLQIEDVGRSEGAAADSGDARRLADALRAFFAAVVRMEVVPEPQAWGFYGSQLGRQVAILPGNKAIIAVHDLDINPTIDRAAARKAIELKFQQTHEQIEAACPALSGRKLNIFKVALVVNNADAMPFVTYPDNGRWKDWRLLAFYQENKAGTARATPVPDQDSLTVFRSHLRAWAKAS